MGGEAIKEFRRECLTGPQEAGGFLGKRESSTNSRVSKQRRKTKKKKLSQYRKGVSRRF